MSDELGLFTGYFTEYFKARVFVQEVTNRGVEIKIECPNMESLASILNHHQCRHLDKLVERCFVTDAIKSVLNLETVTLKAVLEDESRYTEMLGKLSSLLMIVWTFVMYRNRWTKWHNKHQVLNSAADHATSRWSCVFLFLFLFVCLFFCLFCYFCFHYKQSKHTNFISVENEQKV